jgi:hypothetical protein
MLTVPRRGFATRGTPLLVPGLAPRRFPMNGRGKERQVREPPRRRYERELAWYEKKYPTLFAERLSIRHPDYARLEDAFWWVRRPPRDADEFVAQGQFLADDLPELSERDVENGLTALDAHLQAVRQHREDVERLIGRLFDDRDDAAVVRAHDLLGLDAFRERLPVLPGTTEEEELRLGLIRKLVWRKIERQYWAARHGPVAGRAQATATLRRMLMALVPDRRGQRRSAAGDEAMVYERYCRKLFRLLRALRLLREWPWRSSRDEKIEAVAESCGLTARELRSYLKLYAFDRPVDVPGSPERAACEWVADELWLDVKTVAKIRAAMESRWLPPLRPPLDPPPPASPK